ncbi:MAG: Redoxin [Abditibacteriota bacterium]|nr:Redoxin [Abditibacteriota bacterium]
MEAPRLDGMKKRLGNSGTILGIALKEDSITSLKKFKTRHRLTYPIALDRGGRMFGKFALNAIPASVLFDRQGVIRHIETGYSSQKFAQTSARFTTLIRGAAGRSARR